MRNGSAQQGFTYIGLLMMIAISGIGLAALGEAWHTASQREKERELLFAGEQISKAISRYYQQTSSPIKEYPPTLEALLLDKRGPKPQHHLRRIYIDPMTASREWGLLQDKGRIVGVFSRSHGRPFKQDGFDEVYQGFAGAESYEDWQFVAGQKSDGITLSTNPRTPLDSAAVSSVDKASAETFIPAD
ncbi:type II secretion system GspH family protein [Methylobacillus arboreus]|uniref:type II secretion system protein n=1 Tax=Methylobacillus arboreus TaxID=755170 RepID=UPI001E54ECD3|nr:type II secretion system protein [Methylobacillus arboreus]MCB5190621.1 type II secretion system GspH family protein [Methylobacillus arboreus]